MKSWKKYFQPQEPEEKLFRDWEQIWGGRFIEIVLNYYHSGLSFQTKFAYLPQKTKDRGWIWFKYYTRIIELHDATIYVHAFLLSMKNVRITRPNGKVVWPHHPSTTGF